MEVDTTFRRRYFGKSIIAMKGTITSLLLFTLSLAHAQVVIKPGDPIIRDTLIKPSHQFYKGILADSSGRILYEWVNDQVITADRARGRIVFARSRQEPVGNYFTDTSVTDLSFKPLRMHEMRANQDISIEMTFGDLAADVHILRKGVPSDRSYPMKSGYFEDNMIEYVYGYLDLKKGIVYMLDDFNKDAPSPSDPVTIEYVLDDIWTLDTGVRLNCRMLRFAHGSTTGYIWIDKETRAMVKEVGNNKGSTFSITKI